MEFDIGSSYSTEPAGERGGAGSHLNERNWTPRAAVNGLSLQRERAPQRGPQGLSI